ncbi:Transcriptional regulatory protein sin3 [Rhizoclosmatium sp. JEL0117]|nr:Transcriptional regulatory protein sin3 [Rhizoclosmatium sp. JEL0117]
MSDAQQPSGTGNGSGSLGGAPLVAPVLVPSPSLPPTTAPATALQPPPNDAPLPPPGLSHQGHQGHLASAPNHQPLNQQQQQQQNHPQNQPSQVRVAPLSPQLPVPPGMAQPMPYKLPTFSNSSVSSAVSTPPPVPAPIQQQTQAVKPPPSQQQQQQQEGARSLNVKDALSYLDQVKAQFQNQPDVYNRFLDIMKDFKSQSIDTPGVIDRVSTLFRGHPSLVTGFNTFLPPGYRIEATMNPLDPIRVFTPTGLQQTSYSSGPGPTPGSLAPPPGGPGSRQTSVPPPLPPPVQHPSPNVPHHSVPPPQISQQPPPQAYFPPPQQHQPAPVYPPPPQREHVLPPPQPAYAPPPVHQQTLPPPQPHVEPPQPVAAAVPKKAPVEFGHAISYVNKIKNRFSNDPDTYKQFLEILQTYQKESKPIQEVYAQVQILFKGAPDLLDEFKHFLPEVNSVVNKNQPPPQRTGMPPMANWPANDARRGAGPSVPPVAPPAKKATAAKRQGVFSGPQPGYSQPPPIQQQQSGPPQMSGMGQPPSGQPPKKRKYETTRGQAAGVSGGYVPGGPVAPGIGSAATQYPGDAGTPTNAYTGPPQLPPPGPNGNVEELEWIDRCKRSIGNKATYNEFLKVLNLFSNEIIDAKTLVERVEPFLAKSPDLFLWFKKFVKYEEEQIVYNFPAPRPEFDPRTCRKSGSSYRLLPESYPRTPCSGRDDLCREVLNDDWISQPEYISETGFVAHKKTIFEEALHKCEEERYEFDMNIEANLHTIALLEPIYRRIQAMSQEERSKFRLPVGLGGMSKTIYQRVIKKVYDVDKGLEVIEALHNNPSVAVPVVLKRLKQKDEEWKRCQRDWNKVWREVDLKNYHKALDHQGINFKATDRKQLTIKSLTTEIETLYKEQRDRKRNHQVSTHYGFVSSNTAHSLMSTAYTRHQMDFGFPDPTVFRDARKLVLMQVGVTGTIGQADEERIGEFLTNFLKRFFHLDGAAAIEGAGLVPDEEEGGEEDTGVKDEGDDVSGSSSTNGGGASKSAQTLRKEVLLKQATAAAAAASGATLAPGGFSGDDAMSESGESISAKVTTSHVRPVQKREYYPFFANTTFYVFFRLYEILCSRLRKMKELSDEFQKNPPHHSSKLNTVAVSLGLQAPDSLDTVQPKGKDRYTDFIRAVHELFDSKIEATDFEDRLRGLFGTSAYLSYTIDKLVQQIVKQIQSVLSDPVCLDLVDLYFRDRDKPLSSSRQESVYRMNAERVVEDDALYRLDYHVTPKILTFQLINKDEPVIHEGSSVEEKWSVYVDQFIQLSSTSSTTTAHGHIGTGGVHLYRRAKLFSQPLDVDAVVGSEPFLRRNLPSQVPYGPLTGDLVEMRSGLELKICLNTYKMFFVEDTEDYFARRKVLNAVPASDVIGRKRRVGWNPITRRLGSQARTKKFEGWLETRMKGIEKDEQEWVLVDRAVSVGPKVDADGDVEMK